jgi:hypothetical protein
VNFPDLAIAAGDVELAPVLLIDLPLKLGRHFESAFFIDPRNVATAKHSIRT